MPVAARRFIYGLLAALGFIMMVPLVVNMRRIQAEMLADPLAVDAVLDPASAAQFQSLMLLFLLGVTVATAFIYAGLSTGYAKSWRPRENGTPLCTRCGGELRFGVGRCPTCDQHLVW